MAIAHLNFEDAPDGTIDFQACFEGGFDVKSHAHQHAQLLIRLMDEIARREGQPRVEMTKQVTAAKVEVAEHEHLREVRRMASAGDPLIHIIH